MANYLDKHDKVSLVYTKQLITAVKNYTGEDEQEKLQIIQAISQHKTKPIIVIDRVIFQINQGGIARVWNSILQEWINSEFGVHLIFVKISSGQDTIKIGTT